MAIYSVTTITNTGNVTSVTTSTTNTLSVGDVVVIAGCTTNPAFNGTWSVLGITSSTVFTFTQTSPQATNSGSGAVVGVASPAYRPTPAPVGSTIPYIVTYSASLRGFTAYSPSEPYVKAFVQRAKTISTATYIYWTAFGQPDSTGASSGHPAGDLTDVVVIAETA
jgi:hypothetical protein